MANVVKKVKKAAVQKAAASVQKAAASVQKAASVTAEAPAEEAEAEEATEAEAEEAEAEEATEAEAEEAEAEEATEAEEAEEATEAEEAEEAEEATEAPADPDSLADGENISLDVFISSVATDPSRVPMLTEIVNSGIECVSIASAICNVAELPPEALPAVIKYVTNAMQQHASSLDVSGMLATVGASLSQLAQAGSSESR